MERLAFLILAFLQSKLFYCDKGIVHEHLPSLNLLLILFKGHSIISKNISKAFFCNGIHDHQVNVVIFVTEHLHCRYEILRDKLMLEMLKHHIGEGMWTVLSEGEQHERFMQLKMRVQRLRKDDKLDGADGLPGAGALYSATLLALMGLSRIGEESQRLEEAEKIKQMEKEGQFYQLVVRYFTLFEADFISSLTLDYFSFYRGTSI